MLFKDRTGQNLKRKKLTIISQTPNEIIADIERFDDPIEPGTRIDASVMNQFQSEIDTANSNASNALTTAISAANTANTASQDALTAINTANLASTSASNAVTTANAAYDKAESVESQLADRGTTIKVNGISQTEVNFSSDPQTQINSLQSTILLAVYPVGAIYLSVSNVNPGTLFGGTWQQIEDKFLLSAGSTYSAGSTGGEANHTLTVNEIPSHTHFYDKTALTTNGTTLTVDQIPSHHHRIWSCSNWSGNVLGATNSNKVAGVGFVENRNYNETFYDTRQGDQQIIEDTGGGTAHTHTINGSTGTSSATGSGQAHNNMPPYLAVYVWKRIS